MMRCFSHAEKQAEDPIDRESFTMNEAAMALKQVLEASSPIRGREFVVLDTTGRGEGKRCSRDVERKNSSKPSSSFFRGSRRVSENLSRVFKRSAESSSEKVSVTMT